MVGCLLSVNVVDGEMSYNGSFGQRRAGRCVQSFAMMDSWINAMINCSACRMPISVSLRMTFEDVRDVSQHIQAEESSSVARRPV